MLEKLNASIFVSTIIFVRNFFTEDFTEMFDEIN